MTSGLSPREAKAGPAGYPPVGILLRRWRSARGRTQLDLALRAGLSSRHLSFVETGRASPSRAVVLRLADAMDLPIRAQNELLQAAGFAPEFRETPFAALPEAGVRTILRRILDQQMPYPGLVADSEWNIVMRNDASAAMRRAFLDDETCAAAGDAARNIMKLVFDPRLLRPFIANWPEVARGILLRLGHEAEDGPMRVGAGKLLRELMAYPDPPALHAVSRQAPNAPAMTVTLQRPGLSLSYFSVLSTFGTPQDVTLQELRIKLFFPVDTASAEVFQRLTAAEQATH